MDGCTEGWIRGREGKGQCKKEQGRKGRKRRKKKGTDSVVGGAVASMFVPASVRTLNCR